MHTSHWMIRTTLALVFALGAAGCVSTEDRFEKAQELEGEGNYAEAARYYIKVLEKENWPEARERLQIVGARAVEQWLEEAAFAEEQGRFEDALNALDRIDDLRADARGVEVALAVPDDYGSYRARLAENAVDELRRRAEAAEARGEWRRALDAYERARDYTDDPAVVVALGREQARVHLRWAEAEADAARYRAAYERAQQTLDLAAPDDPLAEAARRLRQDALAAGTRYVAFLPFWRTDSVDRLAEDILFSDFNDVMLYEHWSEPTAFIASADPVQLRRELRRLRYDRTILGRREAAELGRAADADYVVVGEWTDYERSERDVKEKTRKAKLRGRAATVGGRRDTTYIEQRLRLRIDGEVAYRIIDVETRRVVAEGRVEADVEERLTRGVYAGDYQDLDLSGSERALFEDAEADALENLHTALVDDLAARLAADVFDRLYGLIP